MKKVLVDCELIQIACSFINPNEPGESRYAVLKDEALREVADEMFSLEWDIPEGERAIEAYYAQLGN